MRGSQSARPLLRALALLQETDRASRINDLTLASLQSYHVKKQSSPTHAWGNSQASRVHGSLHESQEEKSRESRQKPQVRWAETSVLACVPCL